ncbi:MAG: hypothetical protein AAF387_17275, partial [Pseudomonadota bacterium]
PDTKKRMATSYSHCLSNANKALENIGSKSLSSLDEIFRSHHTIFCEKPDFDVYGNRPEHRYIDAISDASLGSPPQWPNESAIKIFAYLKPKFEHLDILLERLSKLAASICAFVPQLSETQRKKFSSRSLFLTDKPLQLSRVVEECTHAICHGGTGTVNVCIDAGIPVFCIPLTVEQMMFSKRVEQHQLGHVFPLQGNSTLLKNMLKDFIADQEIQSATKKWASERETPPMADRVALACDLIEAALDGETRG